MGLKARLNDHPLQSFTLTADQWLALKGDYRNQSLLMSCCSTKAIPKTSKLGTQYFAHARRGECSTAPESAEHLYLKDLICRAALKVGWQVETEVRGQTPTGDTWIADVMCTKGKARVALEVQHSYQHKDEYVRRSEQYRQSGVRCAWFFKLHAHRHYTTYDFFTDRSVPCFGYRKEGDDYRVPEFNVDLSDMVSGMLTGKLQWSQPKDGDLMDYTIGHIPVMCWRCKQETNAIVKLSGCMVGTNLGFSHNGTEPSSLRWVNANIPRAVLAEHRIGVIKERYSKTAEMAYLSNGCIHCDALLGSMPLHMEKVEWIGPIPSFSVQVPFDMQTNPAIDPTWLYRGCKPRTFIDPYTPD